METESKNNLTFISNLFLEFILEAINRVPAHDSRCDYNKYNYLSYQGVQVEINEAIKKAHAKIRECRFFKDTIDEYEIIAYDRVVLNGNEILSHNNSDYYKFIVDPEITVTVFHMSGSKHTVTYSGKQLSFLISKSSYDKGQAQIGVEAKSFGSICTYVSRYAMRSLLGITPGGEEELDQIDDAAAKKQAAMSMQRQQNYNQVQHKPQQQASELQKNTARKLL